MLSPDGGKSLQWNKVRFTNISSNVMSWRFPCLTQHFYPFSPIFSAICPRCSGQVDPFINGQWPTNPNNGPQAFDDENLEAIANGTRVCLLSKFISVLFFKAPGNESNLY